MVRLEAERPIGDAGHTWTDANGLRGEGDILGRGHCDIESKGRLKGAGRRQQRRAEAVEGFLGELLYIL